VSANKPNAAHVALGFAILLTSVPCRNTLWQRHVSPLCSNVGLFLAWPSFSTLEAGASTRQ